ncbi:MAG: cation:proton antiporter [Bryobacter sp.]|nr:cation:proton antiporter [Bryobacter sp.]
MPSVLTFLLQIATVIVTARFVGSIFRRFGQPQVVGEMVAGVLLGPSLLGWAAPALSAAIFPRGSIGYLETLSQIGLLLFMFLVGMEFNPRYLRNQGHTAVITSHASITAPFFLGSTLAIFLYPRLSDASVPFLEFALFMGVSMSITAFPVLARILAERELFKTKLGSIVLACAAVDDVTAWCILAYIVALVRAAEESVPLKVKLIILASFILLMLFAVRPMLRRLEDHFTKRGRLSDDMMAVILCLLLASAIFTEFIGVHLLFGAFLFGAIMPKDGEFAEKVTERIHSMTVVLLLPVFFAFTGLRTSFGQVRGAEMWFYCSLIILVAVAGKFGGSALAARVGGLEWKDALSVGAYMNTRGLMELVVLNIGLDLGVISPALFSMMVLMAIFTTFMTTPVLHWLNRPALQDHVAASRGAFPLPNATRELR